MLATGIFLTAFGVLLIIKPSLLWLLTESWKSADGTEPSNLYIWSTRFGGVMFMLVGISTVVVTFF
ncbi:DUF6199 family natural product biosynthesis protein [Cytobacillus sp. FJAT-54145]|uniref:DUF6199 family natural product biosynthesis protein n=1 Tax=Cytobacillus spartinae TaxID=3299023 RepID=A0ABW6KAL8_9BACI